MSPHEPYWRTNSSFSPPPAGWDFQLQPPEHFQHRSLDGAQLYGSSTSSNSKESRSWVRGNQLYSNPYGSDGAGIFLSGSSDLSQGPQWTPPAIQEFRVDDFEPATRRGMALGASSFKTATEGAFENPDSVGSISFRSDSSGSEPKSRSSSQHHHHHHHHHHHRSFISKPIYPLSFPRQTSLEEFEPSTQSSTGSSMDFADVPETFDPDQISRNPSSDGLRCALCERLLSQRSPWSSRRIVRSGDMPVAGVLPCSHVFHAECLEQTTPKTRKNEPPCPLCLRSEEENLSELKNCSRTRSGNLLRLRPFGEDGPSRPSWGCVQVGDCVEGALHVPPCNAMLLLNRNRVKKNLSLKGVGGPSREFPGKLRKSGSFSIRSVDQGGSPVGCSKSNIKS